MSVVDKSATDGCLSSVQDVPVVIVGGGVGEKQKRTMWADVVTDGTARSGGPTVSWKMEGLEGISVFSRSKNKET